MTSGTFFVTLIPYVAASGVHRPPGHGVVVVVAAEQRLLRGALPKRLRTRSNSTRRPWRTAPLPRSQSRDAAIRRSRPGCRVWLSRRRAVQVRICASESGCIARRKSVQPWHGYVHHRDNCDTVNPLIHRAFAVMRDRRVLAEPFDCGTDPQLCGLTSREPERLGSYPYSEEPSLLRAVFASTLVAGTLAVGLPSPPRQTPRHGPAPSPTPPAT